MGSQPITSVAWLPILRLLVTLSKDGTLQVWKTRVILNPNRPPMQANFFESAGKLNIHSNSLRFYYGEDNDSDTMKHAALLIVFLKFCLAIQASCCYMPDWKSF